MNKQTILIVDDSPEILDVLKFSLCDEYTVRPAVNGTMALRIAIMDPQPDLVLLDVNMPGMDGYEVCRQMKTDPRTHNIPILFVTAKGEFEDRISGLESGAEDYIVKPINPHILRLRVKHHLALRQHREHLEQLVQERTAQLEEAKKIAEAGRNAAEAGNRAKSSFLAVISHELRTPLNTILGFSSILADSGNDADTCRKYATMIMNSSTSLLGIINDVLDYVKLESGEITLIAKPIPMTAWIDALIGEMAEAANRKGLTLTHSKAPELPEILCGDSKRLRQAVFQLLHNAIKFTQSGGITLHVGVDAVSPMGVMTRFSVSDTGAGIPLRQVAEIFAHFSQLEPANTRRHGGIGLGLSLCKLLAERMEGAISLESQEGVGSTFHFTALLKPCSDSTPTRGTQCPAIKEFNH